MLRYNAFYLLLFMHIVLLPCVQTVQAQEPKRPAITGISFVSLRVTDPASARLFYEAFLGYSAGTTVKTNGHQSWGYRINPRQLIFVRDGLPPAEDERLESIAFETDDVATLRRYLQQKGVDVPAALTQNPDGTVSFTVADPDKHSVCFIQADNTNKKLFSKNAAAHPVSARILHAGITVADSAAANHFYRDILGFSEIWRGGTSDTVTSWLNMRVPDGTDYLEYMLVNSKPGRQQLGSLHHIALLVPDMQAAIDLLRPFAVQTGWSLAAPRIGRNNRWQLNLFDADGTRIELMEPFPMR